MPFLQIAPQWERQEPQHQQGTAQQPQPRPAARAQQRAWRAVKGVKGRRQLPATGQQPLTQPWQGEQRWGRLAARQQQEPQPQPGAWQRAATQPLAREEAPQLRSSWKQRRS